MERIIDFIQQNYYKNLTLNDLAEYALCSKYHFSRLFKKATGNTPMAYLRKIRLERALEQLTGTNRTIVDIATSCGFESLSGFYKAFEKQYNRPPGKVQLDYCSNREEIQSNPGEEIKTEVIYPDRTNSFMRKVWNMNVTLKELPQMRVAYVRKTGSYLDQNKEHWQKLIEWSGKNGLYPPENLFIGMSLDDTTRVPENECRHDAAVVLPADFDESKHKEIQFKTIEKSLYGVLSFYDSEERLGLSYQMLAEWVVQSGYSKTNKPMLEIIQNNPRFDPEGKCKVDLCMPVERRGAPQVARQSTGSTSQSGGKAGSSRLWP